jgi:hypothetical protein
VIVAKINWGRVFLGGILAGIVANILAFGGWYLLLERGWSAELAQLGRPIQMTVGLNVFWIVWYLFLGINATWLYAAVRPRFGAGAKTAAIAGLAYWFFAYLLPTAAWGSLTKLSVGLLVRDVVVTFVVIMVTTLVGGWLYRESSA